MGTEVQSSYIGIQRPLRGSRISTFYPVKSLPSLSSLDSAFQLQEYISLLIRLDVHDVEAITSLPGITKNGKEKESGGKETEETGKDGTSASGSSDGEKSGDEKDVSVDEACWIYEQLRRLAQDLTHPLITTLQQECSRNTCPEMKAGEWLYLCVAHGTEGAMEQCCAIDYILHTLDSATALLNSPRAFPSRLQIPTASHRHFSSLARRLGRIFAHAYFHHREVFEQAEAESSLYARFLALTSKFDLVPSEFLVIPAGSHISSGDSDEDEGGDDGAGNSGSGFGLREVKLGTSYDPRRGQGMGSQQHQLPSSFQEEFPDVPRTRRLPQQYQHYQHIQPSHPLQQSSHQQPQHGNQESTMSGTESPKKTGRNRTHTMVLSEAAGVVDDLAKAAAAARAEEEKERDRMKKEAEEREAQAREEAEKEEREKAEAAALAEAEAETETEETNEKDVSEEKEEEPGVELTTQESTVEQQQTDQPESVEENPTDLTEEPVVITNPEDTEPSQVTPSATEEVDIVEGTSSTTDDEVDNATEEKDSEEMADDEVEAPTETEDAISEDDEEEESNTKKDDAESENETQGESASTEESEETS